jgi:hypothetical protein
VSGSELGLHNAGMQSACVDHQEETGLDGRFVDWLSHQCFLLSSNSNGVQRLDSAL